MIAQSTLRRTCGARGRNATLCLMLIIDVREACNPRKTGKGQWTAQAVRALSRLSTTPLILLSNRELPDDLARTLRPADRVVVFAASGLRWHWMAHRFLRSCPDAVFLATTSYLLPALSTAHVKFATVVHDLIAFRGEPHDRRATLIERLTLRRALRRSWNICALSASTAADLCARFRFLSPQSVVAVGAASSMEAGARSPVRGLILCLATLCPRKNQARLIEAFASLPRDVRCSSRLVIAGGRGWGDADIVRLARSTEGVEWRGYVDDAEARRLFLQADIFAYPSLYEGFGLPVIDALSLGIPVLTSSCGSLKEVAGDSALIVDPLSTADIARGLLSLLTDDAVRGRLSATGPARAAQYSWEKTARALLAHLAVDNIA